MPCHLGKPKWERSSAHHFLVAPHLSLSLALICGLFHVLCALRETSQQQQAPDREDAHGGDRIWIREAPGVREHRSEAPQV
jgi:hypothetical protein